MNQVEKVKSICKERKISIHKLEMECGFSNGYISQLKKGTFPTDRAILIAQYLGISLDSLISETSFSNPDENFVVKITPEEAEYLDLLKTATPEAREFVYSVLKRSMQVSGPQD